MPNRTSQDRGQAFPIYVVMVAGLLFLAFAFFAVGQASANRNGAQGAADAAALAAAQDARDKLARAWLDDYLTDPTKWQDVFDGKLGLEGSSCPAATVFAEKNGADVDRCVPFWRPELGYQVQVKSQQPVGKSIIPGTEATFGTASAKAVIKPLCDFELPDDLEILPTLKCKTGSWDLEDSLTGLPDAKDLFDVRLVD
ncbi:pilus assembly protein TadG-related protein [Streptomyces sp. NPDC019396]|uniref:pilus assembly protein TadG-related protein n=1 Tax=Streptomyces sp. NPDC019396 TaxID=3154687 RepID=UPI0033D23F9E